MKRDYKTIISGKMEEIKTKYSDVFNKADNRYIHLGHNVFMNVDKVSGTVDYNSKKMNDEVVMYVEKYIVMLDRFMTHLDDLRNCYTNPLETLKLDIVLMHDPQIIQMMMYGTGVNSHTDIMRMGIYYYFTGEERVFNKGDVCTYIHLMVENQSDSTKPDEDGRYIGTYSIFDDDSKTYLYSFYKEIDSIKV